MCDHKRWRNSHPFCFCCEHASAWRIFHPRNLVVECQWTKSQVYCEDVALNDLKTSMEVICSCTAVAADCRWRIIEEWGNYTCQSLHFLNNSFNSFAVWSLLVLVSVWVPSCFLPQSKHMHSGARTIGWFKISWPCDELATHPGCTLPLTQRQPPPQTRKGKQSEGGRIWNIPHKTFILKSSITFPGCREMFKSFALSVLVVHSDEVNSSVQVPPQSGACQDVLAAGTGTYNKS